MTLSTIGPESEAPAALPIRVRSRSTLSDRWFRRLSTMAGIFTFVVLFLIGVFLFITAWPAFASQGWHFFTNVGFVTQGGPGQQPKFGVQAALLGTVIISAIALVVGVPVAVTSALFISEYAPQKLVGVIPVKSLLTSVVDLMAAVPSVIYGLWGFFVLAPHMAGLSRWLSVHLSFIPVFRVPAGTTIFTGSAFIAGVLVGIMVLPIVTSISREVFSLTPVAEREGALALGASRARVIRDVVLPFGKGGLVGAIMLGLGRALGEAIAVSIIISLAFQNNTHVLVGPTNSIAALIAVRFGSGGNLGLAALLAAGLVLFAFTLLVNTLASIVVNRTRVRGA